MIEGMCGISYPSHERPQTRRILMTEVIGPLKTNFGLFTLIVIQ